MNCTGCGDKLQSGICRSCGEVQIHDHSCNLCPLHSGTQSVCMAGTGTGSNRVMIVGEGPNQGDDNKGQPFTGQAGKLLDKGLAEFAGIARADCYVTNVVKCKPGRPPERAEIKTCADGYIEREVAKYRPDYMLIMGNAALLGILGKSGIMKQRGTTVPLHFPEAKRTVQVMPTIHPLAILRNPKWGVEFATDLQRFGALVKTRQRNADGEVRVKIVKTAKQLLWLRDQLMRAQLISWDIETQTEQTEPPFERTNFQYWHDNESHMTSIAFAWESGTAVEIPLWHAETPWRNNVDAILTILKDTLERPDCTYIAHNGKFDASWMRAKGVNVPQGFDTLLASHILDENRPKELKSLSRSILGADGYGVGEELADSFNMPLQDLAIYNGKDAAYTLDLAKHFRRELGKDETALRLYKLLLMPASRALTEIEANGVYLDPQRWQERHDKASENVDTLQRYIERIIPPELKPINLRSTQQVARWLYDHLELPVVAVTKKTGSPSTGEDAILRLAQKFPKIPELKALLLYRKWYKYLSTYLLPWRFKHRDKNGRIHSSYKVAGPVTGRLAGEGGIQQVPRSKFIRGVLGAEPGWKFVEADYSQIELRIAAIIANEPTMLQQFNEGVDMHTRRAMKILEIEEKHVTKEQRSDAKPVTFGYIYGMGAENFVDYAFKEYGVIYSLKQSEKARNGFFEDYEQLLKWHARQRRLANRYRYVQAPHGRIRRLPDILSNSPKIRGEAERQAINAPVQAMASDIMLFALIKLQRMLPPEYVRIVASVHDAINSEIRDDYVDEFVPQIKGVMEDVGRFERAFKCEINVPITVDIGIGTHWGEPEREV